MRGSRRLQFAFALAATILFAAAPAVRAYCSVELPATAPAGSPTVSSLVSLTEVRAWPATGHDGAGHGDPCCDVSPAAAVDERASAKDGAPFAAKLPVLSFTLTPGAIVGRPAPAFRPTGYHPPPPEPPFRRLPRLLL
jgi:hypothetical protein